METWEWMDIVVLTRFHHSFNLEVDYHLVLIKYIYIKLIPLMIGGFWMILMYIILEKKNLLSENRKLPGGNKFYYAYRKAFSFLRIERIQLGIVYIISIHPSIIVHVYITIHPSIVMRFKQRK